MSSLSRTPRTLRPVDVVAATDQYSEGDLRVGIVDRLTEFGIGTSRADCREVGAAQPALARSRMAAGTVRAENGGAGLRFTLDLACAVRDCKRADVSDELPNLEAAE